MFVIIGVNRVFALVWFEPATLQAERNGTDEGQGQG